LISALPATIALFPAATRRFVKGRKKSSFFQSVLCLQNQHPSKLATSAVVWRINVSGRNDPHLSFSKASRIFSVASSSEVPGAKRKGSK